MFALIRILAQRIAIVIFSILAFFGINPNISPLSDDAVAERREVQQTAVRDILRPQGENRSEDSLGIIPETETKIIDLQKEITQNITAPVTEIVETVVPSSVIPSRDSSNFNIQSVVVNIICAEKTRTHTKLSSGSGVIISPSGVVLTNAHVAFPFLKTKQFDDDTYSCSVRPENIPNYGYNAELVYFPVNWLETNRNIMNNPSPMGTGENDYAILIITTPTGPTPRTPTFTHASINISTNDLVPNIEVVAAGYPGTNSGVFEIDSTPGLRIAQTYIVDFFTFSGRTYDILQTGPNVVAQRGSSGGGIFKENVLYGLIVTTNTNAGGSYINALTIPYIKRDFENTTGINFTEFVFSSHELLKLRFNISYKQILKSIVSQN